MCGVVWGGIGHIWVWYEAEMVVIYSKVLSQREVIASIYTKHTYIVIVYIYVINNEI